MEREKEIRRFIKRNLLLKSTVPGKVEIFLQEAKLHFGNDVPFKELVDSAILVRIAQWSAISFSDLTNAKIEEMPKLLVANKYSPQTERIDLIRKELEWDKSLPTQIAIKDFFGKIRQIYPEKVFAEHDGVKKFEILQEIMLKIPAEFNITKKNLHCDKYADEKGGMLSLEKLEGLLQQKLKWGLLGEGGGVFGDGSKNSSTEATASNTLNEVLKSLSLMNKNFEAAIKQTQ